MHIKLKKIYKDLDLVSCLCYLLTMTCDIVGSRLVSLGFAFFIHKMETMILTFQLSSHPKQHTHKEISWAGEVHSGKAPAWYPQGPE